MHLGFSYGSAVFRGKMNYVYFPWMTFCFVSFPFDFG